MSGRKAVLFIFAGVLAVVVVTLALYFLTRRDEPSEPQEVQPNAHVPTVWEVIERLR